MGALVRNADDEWTDKSTKYLYIPTIEIVIDFLFFSLLQSMGYLRELCLSLLYYAHMEKDIAQK